MEQMLKCRLLNGNTLLHISICNNNFDLVNLLIDNIGDITITNAENETSLLYTMIRAMLDEWELDPEIMICLLRSSYITKFDNNPFPRIFFF